MKKLLFLALMGVGMLFFAGCEKETPWTEESDVYPWIDGARMGLPENPCFPPGKPGAEVIVDENLLDQPDDELTPNTGRDHSEVYPWIDQP